MTVDYDIDFGSIAIGPSASRSDPAAPMFAAVEGVIHSRIDPRRAVTMLMESTSRMDDFLDQAH